jgi:hypothetical protein
LTYSDEDGEEVELDSVADLTEALRLAQQRNHILDLHVREPNHSALLQQSSLVGGGWESVEPSSSSLAAKSFVVEKEEEQPAANAHADKPAPAQEKDALESPPPPAVAAAPAAEERKEESVPAQAPEAGAAAAADQPAVSPSKGWFGGLFGGRVPAPASPSSVVAPPAPSSAPSIDSSDVPSIASSHASLGDSLLEAVDSGMLVQPRNRLTATQAATQAVLKNLFDQALQQTAVALGVPTQQDSPANPWLAPPSSPLLDALCGLQADALEPLKAQFVSLCVAHVKQREMRDSQLAEQAAAKAAAEEAAAAAKAAEEVAAAAKSAEEERVRRLEQERQEMLEQERKRRQEEAAAEAEREAVAEKARAEAEAAKAAAEAEAQKRIAEEQAQQAEEAARVAAAQVAAARQAQAAAEAAAAEAAAIAAAAAAAAPVPAVEHKEDNEAGAPVLVDPVRVPVAAPVNPVARADVARFEAQLSELSAMGFNDRMLNEHFLQQTGGNVGATLDWLQADEATGGEVKQSLERARAAAQRNA